MVRYGVEARSGRKRYGKARYDLEWSGMNVRVRLGLAS
jgi:hypothetical protein